jgi:predicted dehydrogenase
LREARKRLYVLGGASSVQHVHYEMTRVERRDPDFSVTAIHGIDAVRYLAGSDYSQARFRYRELPDLGPGIANIFIDAVMASGATAHLAFCPVAGVLVERAVIHGHDHSLYVNVPLWDAFDSPGRLQHIERGKLVAEIAGSSVAGGGEAFELGGFHAEYVAFLDDLAAGRAPSPSLREARQSVAIAEQIRLRREEFSA